MCQVRVRFAGLSVIIATIVAASSPLHAQRQLRELGKSAKDESRAAGTPVAGDTDCTDVDGDGYGVGDDCAGPDCNDDDASINPAASEACNGTNARCCNGVDDNCNGQADENVLANVRDGAAVCDGGGNDGNACKMPSDCMGGNCVPDSPTFNTFVDLPLGAQCINGLGVCARIGNVVCKADGTGGGCDAVPGAPDPAGEGLPDATADTCFDRLDNDCDGLVDHGGLDENNVRQNTTCTTAELCDGFDNDNNGDVDDGFDLGSVCEVGVGNCVNAGAIVCKPDGSAGCNVSPLTPGIEGPPGNARCQDGKDNDCDGLVDLADPNCQAPEKCDGADNDGDGEFDEDFDLGQLCTAGIGACESSGITICSPDGTGTICTAVALLPTPEQPLGGLCTDGIDNDCDGTTDDADASCGSSNLTVQCALPYKNGKPGNDCTGWHYVRYSHNGGPDAVVTAELVAMNVDGSIIATLPTQHGNEVHIASRITPEDYKFTTKKNPARTWHEMFVPVPLLRVTVQDQFGKATAYCSNIPYLSVIEPNNTVVSSDLADLPVLIMLPRVNVKTLTVLLNGVELIAALGLDPATAFPGGPYSGTADVNGAMVNIEDLVVDAAGIGTPAANTLSFRITGGLGCGGHMIAVDAERAPDAFPATPGTPTPVCHNDDVQDTGTAMVFRIEVTEPTEGEVTDGGPTRVVGTVCHGRPIEEVDVNGFDIDVSGQSATLGDGESSATTFNLDFDVDIPVTNLRQAIAQGDATGSFDPGSNLLVARAMDDNFNTTFDSLTFAVGPIVPAPLSAFASRLSGLVAGGEEDPPNFVQRAFVLGVNTTGLTHVFTAQKDSNKRCMGDRIKRKLRDQEPPPRKIDVECDPWVSMTVNGVDIQKDANDLELDFGISVDPNPDQINVRIDAPPMDLRAHFGGYCESDCLCLFGGCVCGVCVTVDVNTILVRKNMNLTFSVTETNIMQTGIPREEREPVDFNFDVGESDPDDSTHVSGEIDIGCVLGFFLDVVDFFVMVFTLGFVDIDLDILDFEITGDDMKDRFNSLDGDPMELDLVKMKNDEEALDDFDSKQRATRLTDVQITDGGMAVALGSAFEPREDKIDPEARPIPGTPLKNAPVPQPPISDFLGEPASDVTIAISDDMFNQLFYNMTQTGKLKTEFEHVRELNTFMPDDCNTIEDESRRARCIGWKTQDCSAYGTGRTCSDESLIAGSDCLLDAGCHTCAAGSPNAGTQCTADLTCGRVCSGALAGTTCTLDSQCTGTCSAGSSNVGQSCSIDVGCGRICQGGPTPGASCVANIGCGAGGTCVNSGTCDNIGTCSAIDGACDKDGVCDLNPLRRSCVIGKLLAKRFNVRPDTQMILRAKIDEAPKLLIDDDPQCPPGAAADDACRTGPVEVKLHISNLTIAMVADRNNNSLIDGDELTLPECNFSELNSGNLLELENEAPGTIATDCTLFAHCMKIDVNLSMGVEMVGDRSRIKLDFSGIDRTNTGGYQCGGAQSLPELDFFNTRAGQDGSLDQLEGNIRDNTPRMAPEGLDMGGNIAFTLDRILAIRTRPLASCVAGTCSGGFNNGGACASNEDCEDGFQDFIGLTGHSTGTPGPNPPCEE